jgi:L-fuconolactonase
MKIDSHQHFWSYSEEEYEWIDDKMGLLKKEFMPSDLAPLVESIGFDGTIAVQARQSIQETEWLLRFAERDDMIKGVVGWVPLCSSSVNDHLKRFSESAKLVGVRHVLQDEPKERFMLSADFLNGMKCLGQYDLAYDILIYPKQLDEAAELVSMFPNQRFILDHIAKPLIKEGIMDGWQVGLERIAQFPNVYCKLSGMVTEADWTDWKPAHIKPYLDVVFKAFGADRLMIGSDWPICTVVAPYKRVMGVVIDYISILSEEEQLAILGGNAIKAYKLR